MNGIAMSIVILFYTYPYAHFVLVQERLTGARQ